MTNAVLIWNPVAGRGRNAKNRPAIERQFDGEIWPTTAQESAFSLAQKAIENGAKILVCGGGDGTLGEIANAILKTSDARKTVRLGVLPLGTGNDFARTLGVLDLESALQTLKTPNAVWIDVGWISTFQNEVWSAETAFLNVAGCGLDALAARRINNWRNHIVLGKIGGTTAYLLALTRELLVLKAANLKIVADGKNLEKRAILCAIANAQSYGGGMKICPNAQIDDGFFDVCLIKNAGRIEFTRAVPGVFRGEHQNHPKVEIFRARQIELHSEPDLPVLCDGELIGQTPIRARIEARALQILVPKTQMG